MTRNRSRRQDPPITGIGQAHLSVSGLFLRADPAFCVIALNGKKPRPKSNALTSPALAHWPLEALLHQARERGGPVEQQVGQAPDVTVSNLTVRVSPLFTAGGDLKAFLVHVEDASGAEAKVRLLERERENALHSAQQKGEFLANMSHELRTPLNAIIGFLRLIEDNATLSEDERADYLRSARTAAMSLLELVNNILDLAKIEADRLTLESVEFDPLRLVEEACKTLAPQAHGKGIEIAGYAAPEVPQAVQGDPTRLRQVLLNLAGNAVKFTEAGAVTIAVESAAGAESPDTLRFSVRDSGVGIPEQAQKNLFQSYVQRDGSITRRFGGTGLGLAICRQLVEQMGGTIAVESREGNGSTFWFTVPLKAPQGARRGMADTLRGTLAIVLDPNPHTGALLALNLEALGAQAIRATTAWQAQNQIVRQFDAGTPVQLVFVDHALQRDAALSFAHSIRTAQIPYRPDLIYLAAIGHMNDPDALRGGGYSALLTKPVLRSVLGDTALDLLRSHTSAGSSYAAPARKTVGDLTSMAARHQVRVLVAEDNAVNQKLIHALLSKRGYQVTLVPNGKAAVQAVMNDDYEIVLMDVQMPVMDGLSATREIRRRVDGRLPIVAMTADAMEGDRERCLSAGMDDYLSKPILPDQLNAIMEHWLGRATAEGPSGSAQHDPSDWGILDHAHLDSVLAYAKAHHPASFADLLTLFQRELAQAMLELTAATEKDDWRAMASGAARVALISEGFGAPRLEAIAVELEAHCREERPLLARDLIGRMQLEAKSVQFQLQRSYGDAIPGSSAD